MSGSGDADVFVRIVRGHFNEGELAALVIALRVLRDGAAKGAAVGGVMGRRPADRAPWRQSSLYRAPHSWR
ncbi:acyl-CoA carboxylase epsilon subunit [Streptomyces canus]|uniref:acyl-CoA carboxylase epsilon subunit n=1 Tax=Streptomyces canus TaxID=58343 RepID=UPI002F90F699